MTKKQIQNYADEMVILAILTTMIEKLVNKKVKEKCEKCKLKQKG